MHTILAPMLASLGPVAILVLMAVAFAETGILAGFLVPGDSLIFGAGVLLAAGSIHLPLWLSLLAVTLAAAAGDQVGYLVGRRFGPRILSRPRSRFFSPTHLAHARTFFERHGAKAVVLARFIPLARTMTPVVAGAARMPRRRFAAYNLAGAGAWTLLTLGGGYWFGTIPFVTAHRLLLTVAVVALSLLPVVATFVRARRERRTPATVMPTGDAQVGPTPATGDLPRLGSVIDAQARDISDRVAAPCGSMP